jgi:opacity protein-like surface antigen
MTSANYILDNLTDLTLAYDFSHADFTQPNQAAGLPLGVDYQSHGIRAGVARSILKRVKARLEYAWSHYDEPTSAHYSDFTAHGIFATLLVKWD